ncbi:MAG: hypothetical protein R2834_18235 [Rhodothermales bacterium]
MLLIWQCSISWLASVTAAVNFLNSAIGSRVAAARTILIVASVGVFIGASFSAASWRWRAAASSIPALRFAEVIVIFAAVMLADIVLLDMFNTRWGRRRSTTSTATRSS